MLKEVKHCIIFGFRTFHATPEDSTAELRRDDDDMETSDTPLRAPEGTEMGGESESNPTTTYATDSQTGERWMEI